MTEQFAAPPPIPTTTTKPRSKWRWLKITIGIVAAGFLAIGIIGSYNPVELELRRRDLFDAARDGKVLEITNVGRKPIKLVSLTINDRPDCNVHRLDAILGNSKPLFPSTLDVGDKVSISGSCQIIRAAVETDQGSKTYSFNR
ncbi:MAG: hypothetical protein Q7T45_01905 [Bradyrhizobium sp.]|uniref:hypothetical protein n=1 Tax=Bradyrhizobium sp. TaxID=376 RepID=UPI00271B15C4|nr:hypothetical protein [Bradyrhizobium sp.]MDO8396551.1 hypothetical protein [Bradyrhizobium sp.]